MRFIFLIATILFFTQAIDAGPIPIDKLKCPSDSMLRRLIVSPRPDHSSAGNLWMTYPVMLSSGISYRAEFIRAKSWFTAVLWLKEPHFLPPYRMLQMFGIGCVYGLNIHKPKAYVAVFDPVDNH